MDRRGRTLGVVIAALLMLPAASVSAVDPDAPSGERIAFVGRAPGDPSSIYMARVDGTGLKRLSENKRDKYSPSWSPGGTHIVYAEWHACTELVILRLRDARTTRLTDNEFCDVSPDWSPNGGRLAFASDRKEPGESVPGVHKTAQNDYNIYVMPADGSGKSRRLTENPQWDTCPAWSPDGDRIAFSRHRDHNWDIFVMDNDGSNLERLTSHEEADWCPVYSPDGSRIMFTSRRNRTEADRQNTEVYLMDSDGSREMRLTTDPAEDGAGDWSPDGARIIFYSDRSGDDRLHVMDADGNNVQPWGSGGRTYGVDWWSPAR